MRSPRKRLERLLIEVLDIIGVRLGIYSEDPLYPEDHLDLVYYGEVVEYLVDPSHLPSEVRRDLKSNCLLIVMTLNLVSWIGRLLLLMRYHSFQTEASFKYDEGKPKIIRKDLIGRTFEDFHKTSSYRTFRNIWVRGKNPGHKNRVYFIY